MLSQKMSSVEYVICLGILLAVCMQCWAQKQMPGSNSTTAADTSRMESGGIVLDDLDLNTLPIGDRCDPDETTMPNLDLPCHSCGCFPSVENGRGLQGRYKCQLYGSSDSCQELQGIIQALSEACDPEDPVELTDEEQCSCKCNKDKEWKCDVTGPEEDLSPVCQVIENRRFIELPPARAKDITVLFPQFCEADDESYLMGHVMVRHDCEVCVCVDGLWHCKKNADYCDADGMLIQTAVSCSDRAAPFYPLGTYAQEGRYYSICLFDTWQYSSFIAAMRKPGVCPASMPTEGDPACEGTVNECIFDINCADEMKCCFGDCETSVCVTPDYPPVCPDIPDPPGLCLEVCTDNANCTDSQLCCSNGCGYECMETVTHERQSSVVGEEPQMNEERLELLPCTLDSGEMIPTGGQHYPDPNNTCEICVCLNGKLECNDYGADCTDPTTLTCSCGPEGADVAQEVIPFGTVWHVARCDVCICLNGDWQCRQVEQCRPDVPLPSPCEISELISVPTGYMSDNGCCICIDGQWTCDKPGCEIIEVVPVNCQEDGVEVRHGSYTVEDCTLCICVDGNYRCSDICDGRDAESTGGGDMIGNDVCPAGSMQCPPTAIVNNQCMTNDDCNGESICCTNGCVNNCITPAEAGEAGACPEQQMGCSTAELEASECSSDADCDEGIVCCRDRRGCFGLCTAPPVLPRAGLCPSIITPPEFGDIPTDGEEGAMFGQCTMDSECEGVLKCCGGAIKECVTPLDQPEAEQCIDGDGVSQANGYVDIGERDPDLNLCSACICIDGEWICDEVVCTEDAAVPTLMECDVPGADPLPSGEATVLECLTSVCFNGQWLMRDLQACRRERVERPGDCPRGDLLEEIVCPDEPTPSCDGDEGCPGSMKCCFDGCSVSCQQAIEVRSGMCPVPTVGDVSGPCPADSQDTCSVDSDCVDDGSKCCFDGCRSSCQQPAEEPEIPVCLDMEDPSATPFTNGQTVKSGTCNICVCVGKDWLCTEIPEEACNNTIPRPCFDGTGVTPTIPSGTLERRGCMQRVCLNGTWEYSLSNDCCPDLSASCSLGDGNIIATGAIVVNIEGEQCRACICVHGIMVCLELPADECSGGTVDTPCWQGNSEILSGTIIPRGDRVCACLFGQLRCTGYIDKDTKLDLKQGICPAVFELFQLDRLEDTNQRGQGNTGNSRGNRGNIGGNGGNNGGRGGEQDRGNRQGQSGDWDPSGVANLGESSEEEDGGVLDVVRGPPTGRGMPDNAGGQGGGQGGDSEMGGDNPGQSGGRGPGREKRQTEPDVMEDGDEEDQEDEEREEMIQDAIDVLSDTTFDGCQMDADCSNQQICCGRDLGGTCVDPLPEESVPMPCTYGGSYYRHGYLRDASEAESCQACVCVHGEWECDDYNCDEGLADCNVGAAIYGLTVPSGVQQFLQCELCVCLNGDWRCKDRACPNDRSGSLCPAEIPPNINPRNSRYKCGTNDDCDGGNLCCEFDNFGRVCVPAQLPNVKNGDCPVSDDERPCNSYQQCFTDSNCYGMMKCCRPEGVLDRCGIDGGAGICTNPGGNPCPGNRPFTPCETLDPCGAAGECNSNNDLTCLPSVCSSCKAVFFDDNGQEATCQALQDVSCEVPGRPSIYAGDSADNPDGPCNKCVCKGNGELMCNDKKCGQMRRLTMSFEANNCTRIIDDPDRRQEFIDQIRQLMGISTGVPAAQFADFDLSCGSIIVNMAVVEEEGQQLNLEQIKKDIEAQIESGELTIVIDGQEYAPVAGSLQTVEEEGPVTSTTVIVIAVLVTIIALVVIVAVTVCYLKSRQNKDDHEKGDVAMQSRSNKGSNDY